jgi:hypothetical protein
MSTELGQSLSTLRQIAPELNAAADEANAIVATIERFLVNETGIGIPGESSCFRVTRQRLDDEDEDDDADESTNVELRESLAFGRVRSGGPLCVHIKEATYGPDSYGNLTELLHTEVSEWTWCDRDTRLRAFEKLPELLRDIIDKSREAATRAKKTAGTIRAMTADDHAMVVS